MNAGEYPFTRYDQNQFGSAIVWTGLTQYKKVYAICTACMSIWSEFLTWANANKELVVPAVDAEAIVVLGCQVTDLAILNDLRMLGRLMVQYPGKTFYVGGCLAYRYDIQLPEGVRRLDIQRCDHQFIENRDLVDFASPFWVEDYRPDSGDGNLFRGMYPLRISVGCGGNCSYCTIRTTRGRSYELDPDTCLMEYLRASTLGDVLLTADSPSAALLQKWLQLACVYGKPIALRNVEPHVAMQILPQLAHAADAGVLAGLHVPIQSNVPETLKMMRRPVEDTLAFIEAAKEFRWSCHIVATNVIIDYQGQPNPEGLEDIFTHISWNPYWDGHWDQEKAEHRFASYFPWSLEYGDL